jgi:hypothetical protein
LALFEAGPEPNLGRLGPSGIEVPMVSMATLLERLSAGARAGLVKLDIEGGEESLLAGPLDWLEDVDAIVAEFHPTLVDPEPLVARIEEHGFRFVPGGTVEGHEYDVFVRSDVIGAGGSGTRARADDRRPGLLAPSGSATSDRQT